MPDQVLALLVLSYGWSDGRTPARCGLRAVRLRHQSEATEPLRDARAHLAKSSAEVASSADIVLASLPTPDIVKAVCTRPPRHHRRNARTHARTLRWTFLFALGLMDALAFKPNPRNREPMRSANDFAPDYSALTGLINPRITYDCQQRKVRFIGELTWVPITLYRV